MKFIANENELRESLEGLSRLFRQITRDSKMDEEQNELCTLQAIREMIREELFKDEFRQFVGHSNKAASPLKEMFERYINRTVEISTAGGTIEGTIIEVGDDYAEICEEGQTIVLVRLENVISFQLQ
jgi:hypothetical protein